MFRSIGARLTTGLMLGTLLMTAVAGPVAAASHTRWVDNNTKSGGPAACSHANFSTIQAAINASSPGDKVYVCPGNYQEELTIDVRNLEVRSMPALGARLYAPATMTDLGGVNALVNITARDVLFVGFWLKFHDGDVLPSPPVKSITTDCEMVDAAIWAQAPHATIKANHINTVGDNTLSGECGYLFGIVLADDTLPSGGGAWGPDTSLVWRNWIKDFKEGGILTGGDRSVRVFNNNIRYVHYNDPATCNLVPVLGIKDSVQGGDPSQEFPCALPPGAQHTSLLDGEFPYSVGIADEGALVDLRGNTVFSTLDTATVDNQYSFLFGGIFMLAATDGSVVRSNIIDNVFAGLEVSDGGVILPVQPKPSAPDGVAVSGNRVSEGFFSIMVDASDGYYYANRAHLNFVGTVVSPDSANNTFDRNDFRYNVEIDCADDSVGTVSYGTANDWGDPTTNLGFFDDPDGICVPYFQIAI